MNVAAVGKRRSTVMEGVTAPVERLLEQLTVLHADHVEASVIERPARRGTCPNQVAVTGEPLRGAARASP